MVEMRYWNADGGEAGALPQRHALRRAARVPARLGERSGDGRAPAPASSPRAPSRPAAPSRSRRRCQTPPRADRRCVTDDGEFTGWLARRRRAALRAASATSRSSDVRSPSWSPPLRHHRDSAPRAPTSTSSRLRGRHDLDIRSFERGVEGETLACGTGVLAAAAAALAAGCAELPVRALTRGGFALEVHGDADGPRIARWELAGDARARGACVARSSPRRRAWCSRRAAGANCELLALEPSWSRPHAVIAFLPSTSSSRSCAAAPSTWSTRPSSAPSSSARARPASRCRSRPASTPRRPTSTSATPSCCARCGTSRSSATAWCS